MTRLIVVGAVYTLPIVVFGVIAYGIVRAFATRLADRRGGAR